MVKTLKDKTPRLRRWTNLQGRKAGKCTSGLRNFAWCSEVSHMPTVVMKIKLHTHSPI